MIIYRIRACNDLLCVLSDSSRDFTTVIIDFTTVIIDFTTVIKHLYSFLGPYIYSRDSSRDKNHVCSYVVRKEADGDMITYIIYIYIYDYTNHIYIYIYIYIYNAQGAEGS